MSARPGGIKRMQHSLSMRRASKACRAHSEVCRAAEPRSPYSAATSRQVPRFQSPRFCEGFFMLRCHSFSPRDPRLCVPSLDQSRRAIACVLGSSGIRWARAGAPCYLAPFLILVNGKGSNHCKYILPGKFVPQIVISFFCKSHKRKKNIVATSYCCRCVLKKGKPNTSSHSPF